MALYKSDFINELYSRGFVHQTTDISNIDKKMSKNKITAYIGFDATADSLHVGSLIPIMLLSWLQKYGHRPIALLGGGTTMVGDPSGKEETRKVLDLNKINNNKKSIKKIFDNFLDFSKKRALMLDNYQWLSKLNYINFIREVGKHLTINRMLTFDSVKIRLDRQQSLSYLEFNYMILQAYDFYYLNKNFDCSMQMGGSDQWGNIINGIELIRRINKNETYGITSPLVTLASGEKMGKTSSGAVWLNKENFSSYDFYQYWRNINDSDVDKFLKLFTFLDLKEISKLSKLKGSEINEAKKILAYEITKNCRGKKEADKASEVSLNTFEKKKIDFRLNSIKLNKNDLNINPQALTDVMLRLKLINSKSEAKRLIKGGGVKINNQPISDVNTKIHGEYFKNQNSLKIICGKKKIGIVKI